MLHSNSKKENSTKNETNDNAHDQPAMAPHRCPVALLLIDVINDLEWENGELIEPHARQMSAQIAALKTRAKALEIPVVYVNDNFGQWRSDLGALVDHLLKDRVRGEFLARELQPDEDDYFVLKPKHSGFFGTTLDILLEYLGAKTLILTGLAGNICVLFTANDAYMRDFKVIVPRDCLASNEIGENQHALNVMSHTLKADTTHSDQIDLQELLADAASI
ncbi:Nicotinamidase-related amidase [Abditibacterium utsteinense]|uniref:Nicotinamidase-related amidase n=1 Tax=Abditibacterium utsteinense TaxID=1960156 RepID=A0A2S8SSG2_9BACT|nr:isochorismatase family cysteine hydrolase [Abditibacterium utsteinense]PQV63752.1 Nicotinamidase-related amidase [Abditibacterium utsteinense]